MTIQTETAIVPFQGIIQPLRSIDQKILKYSEGNRYRQNEMAAIDYGSDEAGNIYGRFGKELKSEYSLGENIDIYI
jgi:hypothetical protein